MNPRDDTRFIITTLATVVAMGLAAVLAATFVRTTCRAVGCDFTDFGMLGLTAMWAAMAGVVAGRFAWTRDAPTGYIAAAVLAWFTLHFLAPAGFFTLYRGPLAAFEGAMDIAGFFVYWLLAGAMAVAAVWFAVTPLRRVVA